MCYYSKEPITIDKAIELAPCLQATGAHDTRSNRYNHVSTTDILRELERENFHIHGLSVAQPRKEDRQGFQKHEVRLRRMDEDWDAARAPEIILINSHDGSCSYNLLGGIIEYVCTNGLVIGNNWASIRIRHKGKHPIEQVIAASHRVVEEFDYVRDAVEHMLETKLTEQQQLVFAEAALISRYGTDKTKIPVEPVALNHARREKDRSNTLWTTFNRVQENMIKGGLKGEIIAANGRQRKTKMRAVNGIDQSIRLNKSLFTLAETYADWTSSNDNRVEDASQLAQSVMPEQTLIAA